MAGQVRMTTTAQLLQSRVACRVDLHVWGRESDDVAIPVATPMARGLNTVLDENWLLGHTSLHTCRVPMHHSPSTSITPSHRMPGQDSVLYSITSVLCILTAACLLFMLPACPSHMQVPRLPGR
jgi:hypothetical protein